MNKVKIRRFEDEWGPVWELSCDTIHYRVGVSWCHLNHMAYPYRYVRHMLQRTKAYLKSMYKDHE